MKSQEKFSNPLQRWWGMTLLFNGPNFWMNVEDDFCGEWLPQKGILSMGHNTASHVYYTSAKLLGQSSIIVELHRCTEI